MFRKSNTSFEFATLLNNAQTGFILLNEEFKVIYANDNALAILGVRFKVLNEQSFFELFKLGDLTAESCSQMMSLGEGITEYDIPFTDSLGTSITLDVSLTILHVDEQRALLLELKSIGDKRRWSQENQRLTQLNAATDLIRGLAHEIKNPLGGIRGAAQLLERELSSSQQEFTRLIIEQSDRLSNLVDRLLGPNQPPRFQRFNIHRVTETIKDLVTFDGLSNIHVIRDYDPSLPDSFGDPDMLQQALLNILKNAVQTLKHANTRYPEIKIATRIARRVLIGSRVHDSCIEVTIQDNGPGIPQQIRETLFYPMITLTPGGSGLGLSISQKLIQHHQGKIEVNSQPGKTEFIVLLPLQRDTSLPSPTEETLHE